MKLHASVLIGSALLGSMMACRPTEPRLLTETSPTAEFLPITADSLPVLLPKPGTSLLMHMTLVENLNNETLELDHNEEWKWEKFGAELRLLKKDELGKTVTEVYSLSPSTCLKEVDGKAVSPCLPVTLSQDQPNPQGGFTGLRPDGTFGSFSSESSYLGPEKLQIGSQEFISHVMASSQKFSSNGLDCLATRKVWWTPRKGIIKVIETITAKGLKRETKWVLRSK